MLRRTIPSSVSRTGPTSSSTSACRRLLLSSSSSAAAASSASAFAATTTSATLLTARRFSGTGGLDSVVTGPTRHPKTKRGEAAAQAWRGMLGPDGYADSMQPNATPIPGRATVEGTHATMMRSNTFEEWHHVCAEPVGWAVSRLGCATCKMHKDLTEAADSIQLQIIKGLNVFEIDSSLAESYQNINRAVTEVLQAFELDRSGIVFMVRGGIMRQQPNARDERNIEVNNLAPIRHRVAPVIERYKASSLPGMTLKNMMNLEEMTDDQLKSMDLRRVSTRAAACVTPGWLEAIFTTLEFHLQMETIDCFLLEGIQTLYDGRPDEEVEADVLALFEFLEAQVAEGIIQYYGISSPNLAPPLPRVYPPVPPNAQMPDKFLKPLPPPVVLNLHRLMSLAEQAHENVKQQKKEDSSSNNNSSSKKSASSSSSHHHQQEDSGHAVNRDFGKSHGHGLRFLSYPFNLTQSQARFTPLPYEPSESLVTLAQKYKLTTVGYSPVEAPDLQDKCNRYHRFNHVTDLSQTRMNFLNTCERVVQKEVEIKPYVDKMSNPPAPESVFIGSLYACVQRQVSNYFQFSDWVTYDVLPPLRGALMKLREGSVRDIKDWCTAFEQLVIDMIRFRLQLFEHRHAIKAYEMEGAIDRHGPTLAKCPMLSQKALVFATHGADVTCAGFHQSRYFHEATELNPLRGDANRLSEQELRNLCETKEVSFCDYNPPHPFMYERPMPPGKGPIIKNPKNQGADSRAYMMPIDPKNPAWPDIGAPVTAGDGTGEKKEGEEGAAAAEKNPNVPEGVNVPSQDVPKNIPSQDIPQKMQPVDPTPLDRYDEELCREIQREVNREY